MKNFIIILILTGLISCAKKSPNRIMLADKVTITSESPISFQRNDQGGYLEVFADTTGDRLPDIKILVSTLPLEEYICFLRVAYPQRDMAFYNGIVSFDPETKEWTFKPFGGTGDANVKLK